MEFEQKVKELIKAIPRGRVATYGQIASLAGNCRAARQVARVLHSCSEKDGLPWQRVINSRGKISLKPGRGFEEQKRLLRREGVAVYPRGSIDLDGFLWDGGGGLSNAAEKFFAGLVSRRHGR